MVAYVVVPWITAFLEGLVTYGPTAYEPKDFARHQAQRGLVVQTGWTTEGIVNAGLFVLLAVVWFLSFSGGRPGGRWR